MNPQPICSDGGVSGMARQGDAKSAAEALTAVAPDIKGSEIQVFTLDRGAADALKNYQMKLEPPR